jgi:hypothetical protein
MAAGWRNPLAAVRSTTLGIIGLTGLWTGFQIFDSNPPPILDQVLVAAFGVWFATEAKRNSSAKKDAAEKDAEDEDD